MITVALDFEIDLERRKKAALALAAEAGTSKIADLLVRIEPYAEWTVLGFALLTYGVLSLEGWARSMFAPPVVSKPEETGPDGEPLKDAEIEKARHVPMPGRPVPPLDSVDAEVND